MCLSAYRANDKWQKITFTEYYDMVRTAAKAFIKVQCLLSLSQICEFLFLTFYSPCLGGAMVQCQTRDCKVAGSTPGRGSIKSTRSTQPSIPPGR